MEGWEGSSSIGGKGILSKDYLEIGKQRICLRNDEKPTSDEAVRIIK